MNYSVKELTPSIRVTTLERGHTRGHKHIKDRGEIYIGLSGKGIIYEIDKYGVERFHTFSKGKVVYIWRGSLHRVVNKSEEPIKFLTLCREDAGHDYDVRFPERSRV